MSPGHPGRVVVANDPRSYRGVIAPALQAARPWLEVVCVEPARLDEEVRRTRPRVVVCSALSEAVLAHASTWILLYPDGENVAIVGFGGERRTIPAIDFDQFLAAIDAALDVAPTTLPAGDLLQMS